MPAYTNAKQHVPGLFKEIMRNHFDTGAILVKGSSMTQEDWRELKRLRKEMKDYRRAAEEALRWNANKGNTK